MSSYGNRVAAVQRGDEHLNAIAAEAGSAQVTAAIVPRRQLAAEARAEERSLVPATNGSSAAIPIGSNSVKPSAVSTGYGSHDGCPK